MQRNSRVKSVFAHNVRLLCNAITSYFETFVFRSKTKEKKIVARTISHEWAKRTSEILFLPLEHKIHIFSPPCNILYIYRYLSKLTHINHSRSSNLTFKLGFHCDTSTSLNMFWGRPQQRHKNDHKQNYNTHKIGNLIKEINLHTRWSWLDGLTQVHIKLSHIERYWSSVCNCPGCLY